MRGSTFDRDDREDAELRAGTSAPDAAREAPRRARRESVKRPGPLALPRGDAREQVRAGRATYDLRGAEVRTLLAAGTFRSVMTRDVERFIYQGDGAAFRRDLRNLEAQGLIERRIPTGSRARQPEVLSLTRAGRLLLEASRPIDQPTQRYYSGVVKPRELSHDAALYRMAQYEREHLEGRGGSVRRVVLDAELKANVYRAWDQASEGRRDEHTKHVVADSYGLPIVNARIQFPDVRLEVEREDGTSDRIDLELATRHYHRAHLQAKAGFKMYVPQGDDLVARITNV